MPLMKFHLVKGRSAEEIDRLLDVAHRAMVSSFKVPERDRYQILTEHEPSHLRALDTGLDLPQTSKFLLLEVVSRPRPRAENWPSTRHFAGPSKANATCRRTMSWSRSPRTAMRIGRSDAAARNF